MLIHTLKKALTQGSVSLTRHRIDLISRLVCALIQVRSVNMKKLACSLSGWPRLTVTIAVSSVFSVVLFRRRCLPS